MAAKVEAELLLAVRATSRRRHCRRFRPSPEFLQSRYEDALTAYFKEDLPQARAIIAENARLDPHNKRWKNILERFARELQAPLAR